MEITLKIDEVRKIYSTIEMIIDDEKSKINVLLKFRLLGIMEKLKPHFINFEIVKNEKIMEYGKKDKDGSYHIPPEDKKSVDKLMKDITPVLESEVTTNIEPLKVNEVFDKGLKAEYLSGLYHLIVE